ncbi:MAG: hypothetical protein IJT81_07000 [Lachnospiraceae bacterium]|nr:hypothetical protein [Lachnospiraceae bacterium]
MDVVMTKKRTHRVGAITAGASLVGFGVVFLLQQFMNLDFTFIIKFWPLVLIGLGAEIIASTFMDEGTYKYDKGAIALIVIMLFFAFCMAGVTAVMQYIPDIANHI